jgi:hypothetical protein
MTTETPQAVTAYNPQSNARNLGGEKETIRTLQLVCAHVEPDGAVTLSTPIEARWYMARRSDGASPVYCSVWVLCDDYPSGYGHATGGGYHKGSAALQDALHSAGFRFAHDFDGAGDGAIETALHAVADFFDLPKARILV